MAKFCAACGKPLVEGTLFCPNCGARASAANNIAYNVPSPAPQPPKKKKSGLIWGIVGIVLAAVFAVTAFVSPGFLLNREPKEEIVSDATRRRRDKDETEQQTEAESGKQIEAESGKQAETENAVPAKADSTDSDIPQAVINPALIGTWEYYEEITDVEVSWTFNADGTGFMYGNGYEIPIVSYVATDTPYTKNEEDGHLLTVYWGEITEKIGDEVYTMSMDPVEYGYLIEGDTLRIVYSRKVANDFIDFTRK